MLRTRSRGNDKLLLEMRLATACPKEAAGVLHHKDLIHYSRDRIHIVDPVGLEQEACECYATFRVCDSSTPVSGGWLRPVKKHPTGTVTPISAIASRPAGSQGLGARRGGPGEVVTRLPVGARLMMVRTDTCRPLAVIHFPARFWIDKEFV